MVFAVFALSALSIVGVIVVLGSGSSDEVDGRDGLPAVPTTNVAAVSTTAASAPAGIGAVRASEVTCSSELAEHPCHALIDGDPTTAWNAPNAGVGAEFSVEFEGEVRLTGVSFRNLDDDARLMRNARIREVEIHLFGSPSVTTAEIASGHGPYRVRVPPDPTTGITVHVLSTYPGEHVGTLEPFDELALQAVTFTGTTR